MSDQSMPDRTSKVPRFQFASTLDEQEQQLAVNPLVEGFAASRARFARDAEAQRFGFIEELIRQATAC